MTDIQHLEVTAVAEADIPEVAVTPAAVEEVLHLIHLTLLTVPLVQDLHLEDHPEEQVPEDVIKKQGLQLNLKTFSYALT